MSYNTALTKVRWGKILIDACNSFRNAESELNERVLRVEARWIQVEAQVILVKQLAPILEDEHQNIHDRTLAILSSKLQLAHSRIEAVKKKNDNRTVVQKHTDIKRWKYVLKKDSLDHAIKELEEWQRIFDPSWYLIIKAATPQIDVELARYHGKKTSQPFSSANSLRLAVRDVGRNGPPIWLREDGLKDCVLEDIPFSLARLAHRLPPNRPYILDPVSCPPDYPPDVFTKDVRDLARKLLKAEPGTFGLLNCKGVIQYANRDCPLSYTFVFKVPDGLSEPKSLRNILLSPTQSHSLSDRFKLANDLAKSVFYVHTFGFVHKNISPETVLVLTNQETSLGNAFLVGFQQVRGAERHSIRLSDDAWERNLYRHPSRQGYNPNVNYIMQHDIYGLGVCLLELGLWKSFVSYDANDDAMQTDSLDLPDKIVELRQAPMLKDHLVSLARDHLPSAMGTRYAKIVETCLTCLDEDNVDFGDRREFQDEDGILVGVRYIEKVRDL